MASNDDRIARWRARREEQQAARAVHGDLPSALAILAARSEGFADEANAGIDPAPMLNLVLEALRGEPAGTVGDRRRLYDAIGRGLDHAIATGETHSEYAELRRRQLRAIFRAIEADAREGIDVAAVGYRPAAVQDALDPLVLAYQRRRRQADDAEVTRLRRQAVLANEAFTVAVQADEEPDLDCLRNLLLRIDAGRQARHPHHRSHLNGRAWLGLMRYQFAMLRAESRIAIVWNLIGPAVLLGIIATGYYLSGINSVLNMDVPTFAMTGATTWLMFRNVIFRSTASFHAHRWLLTLQPVSPSMVGLSQGIMVMVSYVGVFLTLIGVGHLAGLFTLPDNPFSVAFWVSCVGAAGLAFGVMFGALAVVWPYSPRFAPVIERILQVFSSVILVSEQLPDVYRPWALWSPLAHAMQLLRQAYFNNYVSDDASAAYFFVGLGVLIVFAAICERAVRWRSIPL